MAGRKITIEFLGKDVSASKMARDVEKRFGKLGGKLDEIGAKAGRGLAAGLTVAGAAAYKAGQQASDLAETQSKVAAIFGDESASALQKYADTAANSIGQSKRAALDAAATFGAMGKNAGMAGDDLVGFSTELTTLASDMASFSNTTPEEAVQALGAALRGESEPIRRYNVMLDDATLKARAMKLGIIQTTTQALTPQQKVMAAHAEIMAQTSDQQGDFKKTADGLANSQRTLTAKYEDLGASLGAYALPALSQLVAIGEDVLAFIDNNRRLVGTTIVVIGSLTAAVWAVSAAMRAWIVITKVWRAVTIIARNAQIAFNIAMMISPVGVLIAAIGLLVAGLVIAYKKSATFRRVVNATWASIKSFVMPIVRWFATAVPAAWSSVVAAVGRLGRALRDVVVTPIRNAFGAVVDFVSAVPGRLANLGRLFAGAGRSLMGAFVDGLRNAAGIVSGIAGNVWSAVRGLLNGAISRINAALEFRIGLPGKDLYINPPNIPYLADGGIVTRPTLAMIGEAGAEAVIPLSRGRRAMGPIDGPVANLVVNLRAPDGKTLQTELLRLKRRNGNLELGLA